MRRSRPDLTMNHDARRRPRLPLVAAACLVLAAALLLFYVCYLLLAFSRWADEWLPGAGLRLVLAGLVGLLAAHLAAGAALSRMKRMPGRTGSAALTAGGLVSCHRSPGPVGKR